MEARELWDERAHGSYASRFAEADGDAYEPWHPVAEPLGHPKGVGTGELRTVTCRGVGGSSALHTPDGELIDIGMEPHLTRWIDDGS
jgi:hypothetical protein